MKYKLLGLSAALLIVGAATPVFAETFVTVEQGPAQVIQSWMEPTVERTTEIRTEESATVIREPIVQERHERVIVPTFEKTTTTTTEPELKTIEKRVVIDSSMQSRATVKHHRRLASRPAHRRRHKARHVASSFKTQRRMVSERYEEKLIRPATTTTTETTVEKDVVIDRRDPALDAEQ